MTEKQEQPPFNENEYLSSFIDELAPDETFEVDIDGKRKWKFRGVPDFEEWTRLQKRAIAFTKQCETGRIPGLEDKRLIPRDPENAARIFIVHSLLIEPKLSLAAMVTIAKKSGGVFMVISKEVHARATYRHAEEEAVKVEEGKDDSANDLTSE